MAYSQNLPNLLGLKTRIFSPLKPPSLKSSRNSKPTNNKNNTMPLKTLHASSIPNLDQVHETSALPSSADPIPRPPPDFTIIGHRGNGMNSVSPIKENSILSFNEAGRYPIQFIEFDVQVTSDGHPVIFHDDSILARGQEPRRVADISLQDFLSYNTKQLLRKSHDGRIVDWTVEKDDPLCTLEDAFLKVSPHLGFNIELKFDDDIVYSDEELVRTLRMVLLCVLARSGNRSIMFSTFQPDAARLIRRLQSAYPVYFLTDGGTEIYGDARRNSLEEAVRLCVECGLQGIVSEVRGVLRDPAAISRAKGVGLGVMTYGGLNNVGEVVCLQRLMGVEGVIVDRVREITEAVDGFLGRGDDDDELMMARPRFSESEIGFLLRLIPELIKK